MFYRVFSKSPGLSGNIGRFRFRNGVSLWMHERDCKQAMAGGAARGCDGQTAPYHSICEFEWRHAGIPGSEQIASGCGQKWQMPEGARVTYCNAAEAVKEIGDKRPSAAIPKAKPEPAVEPEPEKPKLASFGRKAAKPKNKEV